MNLVHGEDNEVEESEEEIEVDDSVIKYIDG